MGQAGMGGKMRNIILSFLAGMYVCALLASILLSPLQRKTEKMITEWERFNRGIEISIKAGEINRQLDCEEIMVGK